MRRGMMILAVLAAATLATAQDNLKQGKKSMPDYDAYTLAPYGQEVTDVDSIGPLNRGETMATEVCRLSHYLTLLATVRDTSAVDTASAGIDLWMGLHSDPATMVFIRRLQWTNAAGTVADSDSLTSVGRWWCDVMKTALPNMPYYQLRTTGLASSRKTDGLFLRIEAAAETRR